MTTIRAVEPHEMPAEDFTAVVSALLGWKAEGVENPMIPIDADVDGDGTADAYGLDAFGRLAYVSGAALDDTTIESTGGDVETAGWEVEGG